LKVKLRAALTNGKLPLRSFQQHPARTNLSVETWSVKVSRLLVELLSIRILLKY